MIRKNVSISDMRRTYADVLPSDLKQLREEKGLSQAQLAKELDLSVTSIKKYESGEVAPSIEVLTKMSELYDVDFLISYKAKHPLLKRKTQDAEDV
jgi:transcriptional regulator with XRE-family HTH domain